ncbi:unnamed protein product [Effrenium voratum]|nr:unnamed protein product [Effrenium voratum]
MPVPTPAPSLEEALGRWSAQLRAELRADVVRLEARLKALEKRLDVEGAEGALELAKPAPSLEGNHLTNESLEAELEFQVAVFDESESKVAPVAVEPEAAPEEEGLVHFGSSAWTFPVVIGLAPAGPWDVTFAIMLLLLNLGMQAMFSYIILGEDFMGPEFASHVSDARRWRTSIAHDHKYMDLAATSLVSRVCGLDGSLILSTNQANLVGDINSFLGLRLGQFSPNAFQPGVLLCMLCILLWSLCVYKELRNVWHTLEALLQIPRTKQSIFRENMLHGLSKGRLKMLLFTLLVRTLIACVLLVSGIQWLAKTTSITELMLNAVALNAILDIDEFLFAGFTPVSIQLAVDRLEPCRVKYSSWRSQVESCLLFVLLVGTVMVPYFLLLEPQGELMLATKMEMCGGNQTFVVGKNQDTQVIVGLNTEALGANQARLLQEAVQKHIWASDQLGGYISFVGSNSVFSRDLSWNMEEEAAQWTICPESDVLTPGGLMYQDPFVSTIITNRLRSAGLGLGFAGAETCAEVAHLCDMPEARLLRLMCGVTSSPWFKTKQHGCADSCTNIARAALSSSPCQDKGQDESWRSMWDSYMPSLSAFYNSNISEGVLGPPMINITQTIKEVGCPALAVPALAQDLATGALWCRGHPPLYRPLAWEKLRPLDQVHQVIN